MSAPEASTSTKTLPNDPSVSSTTLLISSLAPTYTSESLSTLLSSVGPIRTAFIVGQKGYGFAKFVLKEDADKAIKDLNGTLVDGRRISVKWAKRRHRGDPNGPPVKVEEEEETSNIAKNDDFVSLNVKNAYATRREAKRQARGEGEVGKIAIDNARDAKTIIVTGELDFSNDEHKKALQKKLKKLVHGINTGHGQLTPHDIQLTASSQSITSSNNEEGQASTATEPTILLECPNSKSAHELEQRINNSVLKGHLLAAKNKFENDLMTRKGFAKSESRLIVRNLGFDVNHGDLLSVFCPFGALHSISLHKGYAFINYLHKSAASQALDKVNNTRIYHGIITDRIEEAAKPELTSIKRKKEKGKILGVKGRIVAVDWALGKEAYLKAEEGQGEEEKEQVAKNESKPADLDDSESESDEEGDSDLEPIALNGMNGDESENERMKEEDEDLELDPEKLAGPSDAESEEDDTSNIKGKAEQGVTLFVRNIQFESTEDQLYHLFKAFGPVRYARIVMDPITKRSRGTGFVNFYKAEDAQKCLDESIKISALQSTSTFDSANNDKRKNSAISQSHQSLLTVDPSSSLSMALTLNGRVLGVSEAASKGQAEQLRQDRDRNSGSKKDKRNLYLMQEGVILEDSPLAANLAPSDLQNRQSSFEARRNLLRTNPSLYISKNRLAIRQIPLHVTDNILKKLGQYAIRQFDAEVKAGRRSRLTADEMKEDAVSKAEEKVTEETAAGKKEKKYDSKIKQAKILRQDDRVDLITGLKRSKGYGFLETTLHSDALKIVRYLNGNNDPEINRSLLKWWKEDLQSRITSIETRKDDEKDKALKVRRLKEKLTELEGAKETSTRGGKSLIFEFSIENALTVKRRNDKIEKAKENDSKKRKRAAEEKEEESEEGDEEMVAESNPPKQSEEKKKLGYIVGKKRRLAKAKKGKK